MIPHPQRCETCTMGAVCPVLELLEADTDESYYIMDLTAKIGCASHSSHTPAPAPTFSEEECEYLEELILDNIEQYPDSGSFTPEKRDALYQKIAFKVQAGDP